jgi:glutathione synthase/RimK-type ligase-like ATP-grasp enzyme
MKTIVVISHHGDEHLPFVEPYLTSKTVVIDPHSILDKDELSYEFDGTICTTSYRNKTLSNVKSVWYRKPSQREHELLPVKDNFQLYARTAVDKHVQMLRSQFQEAFWLSDFYAINKARNKAWQLHLAASMGFRIPKTIITSDAAKAQAFIDAHSPVIVKTQAVHFPAINEKTHYFYAKRLEQGDKINLANLHLAPAIFQEAIDAAADIRVTVVGDQCFAAVIKTKTDAGEAVVRDWRFNHSLGMDTFTNYDKDMPRDLRDKCISLVQKMGLAYGAIDLVVDKKGNAWFLEINPNGQWAFIEQETGQPIGKALAGLLENGGV